MQLKDIEDKNKVIILIQSRVYDRDASGFLGELDGFEKLELPILYTRKANECKWRNWIKLDN